MGSLCRVDASREITGEALGVGEELLSCSFALQSSQLALFGRRVVPFSMASLASCALASLKPRGHTGFSWLPISAASLRGDLFMLHSKALTSQYFNIQKLTKC